MLAGSRVGVGHGVRLGNERQSKMSICGLNDKALEPTPSMLAGLVAASVCQRYPDRLPCSSRSLYSWQRAVDQDQLLQRLPLFGRADL